MSANYDRDIESVADLISAADEGTLDESVLDAVRQSEPTAQLDSGPRDDGQVLEELLADFHRHELVRIPGLYQSLANLVRSATPGSSEAPDSFKLLIPQRTSNSDVPADDTERQVWDQIKIIEEQYASEAQKVEQVCEDVVQRMKKVLVSHRRSRHVPAEEEDVHEKAIRSKFQPVRALLRDRYQEYILYCHQHLPVVSSSISNSAVAAAAAAALNAARSAVMQKQEADKKGAGMIDGASATSDSQPKKRGNLPKQAVERLHVWLKEHWSHPYPSEEDKEQLAEQTSLSISQVSNWFINARVRIWRPEVHKKKIGDEQSVRVAGAASPPPLGVKNDDAASLRCAARSEPSSTEKQGPSKTKEKPEGEETGSDRGGKRPKP